VKVSERELDFGNVKVLKDYYKTVTIINEGKIAADFYAFTKLPSNKSVFKPI